MAVMWNGPWHKKIFFVLFIHIIFILPFKEIYFGSDMDPKEWQNSPALGILH